MASFQVKVQRTVNRVVVQATTIEVGADGVEDAKEHAEQMAEETPDSCTWQDEDVIEENVEENPEAVEATLAVENQLMLPDQD